jgi:hypothetical protein
MEDWGTKLAAFNTIQLPAAIQMGDIHPWGIMAGKFHGAIPAKTPTGSWYSTVSYPVEIFMADSPFKI